jgi:hypothetical protein
MTRSWGSNMELRPIRTAGHDFWETGWEAEHRDGNRKARGPA